MSREALSLEISKVVSRVVSGEPVDAAARGMLLAQKYPDLGMSGEMIGEAIVRAANMVGMIKSAPMPADWPADPVPRPAEVAVPKNGAGGMRAYPPRPVLAQSIEDDLGSAIDAEIGNLVSGRAAAKSPKGDDDRSPSGGAQADAAEETRRAGPLAALRRAFFRH